MYNTDNVPQEFSRLFEEDLDLCEGCGEASNECVCEEDEDFVELSGKVEDIIINPQMDPFHTGKNSEMESYNFWKNALPVKPTKVG